MTEQITMHLPQCITSYQWKSIVFCFCAARGSERKQEGTSTVSPLHLPPHLLGRYRALSAAPTVIWSLGAPYPGRGVQARAHAERSYRLGIAQDCPEALGTARAHSGETVRSQAVNPHSP